VIKIADVIRKPIHLRDLAQHIQMALDREKKGRTGSKTAITILL
jgi:dTDP-4-dehydrorhamnose reductase